MASVEIVSNPRRVGLVRACFAASRAGSGGGSVGRRPGSAAEHAEELLVLSELRAELDERDKDDVGVKCFRMEVPAARRLDDGILGQKRDAAGVLGGRGFVQPDVHPCPLAVALMPDFVLLGRVGLGWSASQARGWGGSRRSLVGGLVLLRGRERTGVHVEVGRDTDGVAKQGPGAIFRRVLGGTEVGGKHEEALDDLDGAQILAVDGWEEHVVDVELEVVHDARCVGEGADGGGEPAHGGEEEAGVRADVVVGVDARIKEGEQSLELDHEGVEERLAGLEVHDARRHGVPLVAHIGTDDVQVGEELCRFAVRGVAEEGRGRFLGEDGSFWRQRLGDIHGSRIGAAGLVYGKCAEVGLLLEAGELRFGLFETLVFGTDAGETVIEAPLALLWMVRDALDLAVAARDACEELGWIRRPGCMGGRARGCVRTVEATRRRGRVLDLGRLHCFRDGAARLESRASKLKPGMRCNAMRCSAVRCGAVHVNADMPKSERCACRAAWFGRCCGVAKDECGKTRGRRMPLEAQTSFAFGSSSELRVQKGGGSSNCSTRRPRRPKFPRFLAALGPAPMRFPGLFLTKLPCRTSTRTKDLFFRTDKARKREI
ncbi:hypothetical protein L1887_54091 [Cichorium endivia]|nr:hypothetical protein L1887_54091 [Cichorium endivia]